MTRIRTAAVGSWPIPFGQRGALKRYYAGEMTDPEASPILVAAARIAMDEQIACGLDQITGGEVFAPDFVHHVPPRLAGLETVVSRDPSRGYRGIGRYRIVGEVTAPRGTGHALAFRRERAIEPDLDKATVPSPLTIAMSFAQDPRLEEQLENLARVVDDEMRAMVADGAGEIQLDAPVEAIALADGTHGVRMLADSIARAFLTVPPGVCRTVHFCLGDVSRRAATEHRNLGSLIPLVQALEGRIDRAHIECSHAGQWTEHTLLADIPESMEVIAGVADVKSEPEPFGALAAKIEALLAVLPESRLLVSSSCGCGRVPHDEAIRLMRNLVKAAGGEVAR